jgi:hypothetical protein
MLTLREVLLKMIKSAGGVTVTKYILRGAGCTMPASMLQPSQYLLALWSSPPSLSWIHRAIIPLVFVATWYYCLRKPLPLPLFAVRVTSSPNRNVLD